MKILNGEQAEFASENEVRQALGLKVEEQWGQKGIKKQYTDNIQNLPMEEFLQIYVPEPEGMQFNDIGDTLTLSESCGYIQTIQSDSTSRDKKYFFQKRVQMDSTEKAGNLVLIIESCEAIKQFISQGRKVQSCKTL